MFSRRSVPSVSLSLYFILGSLVLLSFWEGYFVTVNQAPLCYLNFISVFCCVWCRVRVRNARVSGSGFSSSFHYFCRSIHLTGTPFYFLSTICTSAIFSNDQLLCLKAIFRTHRPVREFEFIRNDLLTEWKKVCSIFTSTFFAVGLPFGKLEFRLFIKPPNFAVNRLNPRRYLA